MSTRTMTRLWGVVAVALFATAGWAPQSAAGTLVDVVYTAVVTDIYDPFEVFAGISLGSPVNGALSYSTPVPPGDISGAFAYYPFDVAPGGGNQMSAIVGSYDLRATQRLAVQVYGPDYGLGAVGVDFQFNDADSSSLSTAGLPSGYQISLAGALFGVFSTDLSTTTFPSVPAELLPLSRYDSYITGGFFFVDILDARGAYVDSTFVSFSLTALHTVPEPSSIASVFTALGIVWVRRHRARTRS